MAHFSNLLWKKALQQISCAQSQRVPKAMKSHPRENIYHESSTGALPYPTNTNGMLDLLRSGAPVYLADTNGPGVVMWLLWTFWTCPGVNQVHVCTRHPGISSLKGTAAINLRE